MFRVHSTRTLWLTACLLVCSNLAARSEVVLDESFDLFEVGTVWEEHGTGLPNIAISVIAANDSQVLMMQSNGEDDEFYGIETIQSFSLTNVDSLTVHARLRPINAGVQGTRAAAEVAVLGGSGEMVRAFASNNAGPDPESTSDWANHYEDSLGNFLDSPAWPHCDLACDAIRDLILIIDQEGTTLKAFDDLDDPDFPTWEDTTNDFKLADLGATFRIALRQGTVSGGDDAIGFFDQLTVSTTVGAAGIVGDFSGNGQLDLADIDLLTSAVAAGNHPAVYDLTADRLVNSIDLQTWVSTLRKTWIGDANLDGQFNSGDFVEVFQKGKYEQAGQVAVWSEGDWNGDGVFSSGDFIAAFQDGGYEAGSRAAVASVPEPSVLSSYLLWMAIAWNHRRLSRSWRFARG